MNFCLEVVSHAAVFDEWCEPTKILAPIQILAVDHLGREVIPKIRC